MAGAARLSGWPTFELLVQAAHADAADGLNGAQTSRSDRAVSTQAMWSGSDFPSVLVTCCAYTKDDLDETLIAFVRRLERLQCARTKDGSEEQLRIVVPVTPQVAGTLLHGKAECLKALCRRAVCPLRVTVEGSPADAERLLVIAGPPEALLTALPDLNTLIRTHDEADAEASARQAVETNGARSAAQAVEANGARSAAQDQVKRKRTEGGRSRDAVEVKRGKGATPTPETRSGASSGAASSSRGTSSAQSRSDEKSGADALKQWLKSLDGGKGSLLMYMNKLNELFDEIEELDLVARGPKGEIPDPQFFEDLHCKQAEHQDLFRAWFKTRRVSK